MKRVPYYSHGDRKSNKVALTFDDGPNPFFTPKLLKLFDAFQVKATFFLIGKWAERYPSLTQRIKVAGHLIGNHSYSHSRVFGDFQRGKQVIEKITSSKITFLRPPYLNLKLCVGNEVKRQKVVTFDVDSRDWAWSKSDDIVKNINSKIRGGSIVGFHDGSELKKEWNKRPKEMMIALHKIIPCLKKRYTLVNLQDMSLAHNAEYLKCITAEHR